TVTNGSGKTTTLTVISGYYMPQRGRAVLKDAVLTQLSHYARAHLRIARTFQTPRIVGEASVIEHVMMRRTIDGVATFVESPLAPPRHWQDEKKLRETA